MTPIFIKNTPPPPGSLIILTEIEAQEVLFVMYFILFVNGWKCYNLL